MNSGRNECYDEDFLNMWVNITSGSSKGVWFLVKGLLKGYDVG